MLFATAYAANSISALIRWSVPSPSWRYVTRGRQHPTRTGPHNTSHVQIKDIYITIVRRDLDQLVFSALEPAVLLADTLLQSTAPEEPREEPERVVRLLLRLLPPLVVQSKPRFVHLALQHELRAGKECTCQQRTHDAMAKQNPHIHSRSLLTIAHSVSVWCNCRVRCVHGLRHAAPEEREHNEHTRTREADRRAVVSATSCSWRLLSSRVTFSNFKLASSDSATMKKTQLRRCVYCRNETGTAVQAYACARDGED